MSQLSLPSRTRHEVSSSGSRRQGRWWILTIPFNDWTVPTELPDLIAFLTGQQELGHQEQSYHHWQLFCITKRKTSLIQIKSCFTNTTHGELTHSKAAENYCLKDDTAIDGTRFELGVKPFQRNDEHDWDRVWQSAIDGQLLGIPASIRIQHYRSLRQISADFATPQAIERRIFVYWGRSGSGKSRRAWLEAGPTSYSKDPRSKFWYGYKDEKHVIFDEFRGGIDIAHVLRWFDRYPVNVERKGSSGPLMATDVWITSNKPPCDWYPELDSETFQALNRRFTEVIEFE